MPVVHSRRNQAIWMSLLGPATLVVGVAGTAIAGPLEDVMAAADRGDYAAASWLLRPLAEHGQPVAQFDLGLLYDTGRGVDYDEAMKWYRRAAQQGYGWAQFYLGVAFTNDQGVPKFSFWPTCGSVLPNRRAMRRPLARCTP
jgi:TPR repeat protein